MEFNYFSYLCFVWAAVGVITRVLMVTMGDRWNKWEMEKAYASKKPGWIYVIALLGLIMIAVTWYQVFNLDVRYSWIMAVIVSLTTVKLSALLFKYDQFKQFASETLSNPQKMKTLNVSVLMISIIFIALGVFVY
jgi:protein-S-isoprenylcysteine O-methyltransferase Ste14